MTEPWAMVELLDSRASHVIPLGDLRDHDCGAECWCRPVQDEEDLFWMHNAMDGREAFEDGRRSPS